MSSREFERLQELEDQWWALMAERSLEEGGTLGPEESEKFLEEILNAPD